jgi:hypothetical protein
VSLPRPPLTTERRLGPGPVLRAGATAPYRAVAVVDGEPHIVRNDFGVAGGEPGGDPGAGTAPAAAAAGPPLLCLVHLTDVQLADVEAFLAGPARTIAADSARRPITRRDFVEAHFLPGARPAGHGFTAQNPAGRHRPLRP